MESTPTELPHLSQPAMKDVAGMKSPDLAFTDPTANFVGDGYEVTTEERVSQPGAAAASTLTADDRSFLAPILLRLQRENAPVPQMKGRSSMQKRDRRQGLGGLRNAPQNNPQMPVAARAALMRIKMTDPGWGVAFLRLAMRTPELQRLFRKKDLGRILEMQNRVRQMSQLRFNPAHRMPGHYDVVRRVHKFEGRSAGTLEDVAGQSLRPLPLIAHPKVRAERRHRQLPNAYRVLNGSEILNDRLRDELRGGPSHPKPRPNPKAGVLDYVFGRTG